MAMATTAGRLDARQEGYAGNYDRQQQGNPQYRSSQREHHDPDYSAWRQEQLRLLDEDYDSWRNERYQKFSDEFNTWRTSHSRNEGLLGSNQSGQVTQGHSVKNHQVGSTAASNASTAASGKSSRDTS
jgi:hypothetical protein